METRVQSYQRMYRIHCILVIEIFCLKLKSADSKIDGQNYKKKKMLRLKMWIFDD